MEGDLILYHGTNVQFNAIEILPIRYPLDFGVGFYTTSIKSQAIDWANRKSTRFGGYAYIYEIVLSLDKLDTLIFEKEDGAWLDFVSKHRQICTYTNNGDNLLLKSDNHHKYDIVSGGVADDKVIMTVDLYMQGLFSRDEALKRLLYTEHNHQLVISTERALHNIISFKELAV